MKKVLVTGATGFIGKYVIEELLMKGYDVVASSLHVEKAASENWFSSVVFKSFDMTKFNDELDYFDYFNRPDFMIHLAWEGLPNYMQDFHINDNLPRHKAFVLNMLRNGLKDLTVAGTCFEYGMQSGCLNEMMQSLPENPYAIAKNTLREFIESLASDFTFSFKWTRLFYMYGEGQYSKSLIPQLESALAHDEKVFNMSGGMQVRDFLPVNRVAELIVIIATQSRVDGIINCCSGNPVTVKEFVLNYLASKNKHITLNLGYYDYASYEPMEFWGDTEKINLILQNNS